MTGPRANTGAEKGGEGAPHEAGGCGHRGAPDHGHVHAPDHGHVHGHDDARVAPSSATPPSDRNPVVAALVLLLSLPIHVYRYTLSPLIGRNCRYEPSCSAYGLEALKVHGPVKGLWLTLSRISRCHPWGGMGHDPVPPRKPRGR
ncbi:membrane protein insertion efficiency factor YidD [Rhodovulum sp. DZ06]|uniref:membrane protein insertion efficiency factor YidD n=1 Tax=Rhodovulum sp. DZ06 TaxID=3425126 RepID=UPI003D353120